MHTVKGYEALEIADRYGISLYDLHYKSELSTEQARQFIKSRRDPDSFVLKNWPDSEKEAEQIVLNGFRTLLTEQHRSPACLSDIFPDEEHLHLHAAEMAAKRLVNLRKLEPAAADKDGYSLPRALFFTDEFLKHVRSLVCEDCAGASPEGPFHESCLQALLNFLRDEPFVLSEIVEQRQAPAPKEKRGWRKIADGKINIQELSKKVSNVRSKWQVALKPLLHGSESQEESVKEGISRQEGIEEEEDLKQFSVQMRQEDDSDAQNLQGSSPRITKQELIRYLEHVEIVDESGELGRWREERAQLLNEIDARDRTISQMEEKRAFYEKQCEDMQGDIDTLLEAMKIAKRRGYTPSAMQAVNTDASEDRS